MRIFCANLSTGELKREKEPERSPRSTATLSSSIPR